MCLDSHHISYRRRQMADAYLRNLLCLAHMMVSIPSISIAVCLLRWVTWPLSGHIPSAVQNRHNRGSGLSQKCVWV